MEENQPITQGKKALPPKITKENINNKRGKHNHVFIHIKTVLCLIASALLLAISSYALIAPNKFTIGGVSGIAILVNIATGEVVKQSWILFAINLPLILLAFFYVKKRFAILTTSNIVLQTIFLTVLEQCFPHFRVEFIGAGERIFAAMAGGIGIGAAIALAFKIGGSTGGVDIIVVMIQKKFKASSIASMMFVLNCIVIGASFFVLYDKDATIAVNILPVMMSVFESYLESKTNDSITNGFQSAIEFRIITNKPDEMSHALMQELSRGVTALPATGMYTKEEKAMLLCVISRRQVTSLRRIMKQIDPDSFAVMSGVSQVLGLGFYISEF